MGLTLFLLFLTVFSIGLCFIIATAAWGFWQTRVPYVRSNSKDTAKVLDKIAWKDTDVFFDLGSGDGRVVFMVEQKGVTRLIGFELTVWTFLQARVKKYMRKSNARFYRKNFFNEPWSGATVIYCYLYPPLMHSVEEKFLRECASGTILISRDFPLPTLRPVEVINFNRPYNAYMYKKQF